MAHQLESIVGSVSKLAVEAGNFIREAGKRRILTVESKSKNNFVTQVDKGCEEILVKGLTAILPEAGFITEEGTATRTGDTYNWVVDPLDGTTNFIHGIPCFAISIGLLQNDVPVAGVIYEVNMDECFYAWQNGGAWLNHTPISVSPSEKVIDSLVATGFPYHDLGKMPAYLNLFGEMVVSTRGMRRLGSAATDLAYVACGRLDAFYEYSLSAWDVAAGIIIVKEAGGAVTDFRGGNNCLHGGEILATNTRVHPDFLSIIQKQFN